MEQRPLEYTVKIYCEGFTEWYYFEWLRTNNRFKFSMEPDIPKNSRSSYKQNLKLIDKELRKNPQERADAIFLVIDTDTLVKDKAQYAILSRSKGEIQEARSDFHRESPLHRDLVSLSSHGQVCANQLRDIRGFASCH